MNIIERIQAPTRFWTPHGAQSVFLAGAIDQGKAVDWQREAFDWLNTIGTKCGLARATYVYDPRRDDYDAGAEQSIHNDYFVNQVNWEIDMIQSTTYVLMHFPASSIAPISLLELGLVSGTPTRVIVSVEHDYWRRGNIEVMCNRFGIPLYQTLRAAVVALYERLR